MKSLIKHLMAHPALTRRAARGAPRVVSLCYHDLREDDDFANWLRVGVADFDAHLAELGRLGRFIAPEDLDRPESLAPGLNFLITFDDGYVNNLRLARPLLAKHRAPALIFVSTRPMAEQTTFWSDVVVTAVQGARLRELDLGEFGFGAFAFAEGPPAGRWEDVDRLLVALKSVGNADHPRVAAVLEHLRERFADVLAEHLPRFRPLTADEAAELAADPWVRLGAHGHDHAILTYLDDDALDLNLREPRRRLEALGAGPVTDLAYPNGDHDARVAERAAAAGYRRAWTTAPGLADAHADPLRLGRILVGAFDPPWLLRFQINRLLLGRGR